jgi:hypothetical protein
MTTKLDPKPLYHLDSNHHVILMYLKMVKDWTTRAELNHFSLKLANSRSDVISRTLFRLVQNGHIIERTNEYGFDQWKITPAGVEYVLLLGRVRALLPRYRREPLD